MVAHDFDTITQLYIGALSIEFIASTITIIQHIFIYEFNTE